MLAATADDLALPLGQTEINTYKCRQYMRTCEEAQIPLDSTIVLQITTTRGGIIISRPKCYGNQEGECCSHR